MSGICHDLKTFEEALARSSGSSTRTPNCGCAGAAGNRDGSDQGGFYLATCPGCNAVVGSIAVDHVRTGKYVRSFIADGLLVDRVSAGEAARLTSERGGVDKEAHR